MLNIISYGLNFSGILIFISLLIFLNLKANNAKNFIILIISLELFLLAIALLFIHFSFILDDLTGSLFTLILLPLAGSESAIALSILISYFPKRGTLITQ
jgi:NADH:ubiquinone oxidoreductase subunit K